MADGAALIHPTPAAPPVMANRHKCLKYKTFFFHFRLLKAALRQALAAFSGTIPPNELPNEPVCDRPEAV
jgi:hypothetical protein